MHPLDDLSAYVDGELDPGRRSAVDSHLAACDRCRARTAELRATTRLIAALPMPQPARSLVPRVRAPRWVAPLRTLATLASGVALFAFVATSLGSAVPLGTGGSAAAPAPNRAPAPEAQRNLTAASPTPTGVFGPVSQPAPAGAAAGGPSATPAPSLAADGKVATQDRTSTATSSPDPRNRADYATSEPTTVALGAPDRSAARPPAVLWLAAAVAFAALAFVLHRRLRTA